MHRKNNLYFEVIHYAREPEIKDQIIESGNVQFKSEDPDGQKRELDLRLGFKFFITPQLATITDACGIIKLKTS